MKRTIYEPEHEALRCELHARRADAFGALAQWALQKMEIESARISSGNTSLTVR